MPRPRKPPRLVLRLDRDGIRRYVIKDGGHYRRTGSTEDQAEAAAEVFREYLGRSRRPNTSARRASEVRLSDVLTVYLNVKETTVARPAALRGIIYRLNEFWGGLTAAEIKGDTCRRYQSWRGTKAKIASRRELESLRAAVHYYAAEHGLDVTPRFTLGENHKSRDRWLTRSEAAALLRAAWRSPRHRHLVRFILIGIYTGTRPGAIQALQWMSTTTGGFVDLERGVMHRRGTDERETNKRRPPTRIPRRLLAHLRRWKRLDEEKRHIVRHHGKPVTKLDKAFRAVRRRAGLSDDVTPHVLRHTRCTWLAQAGVPIWEAAGSVGMTVQQFEATYGHHHPDFQKAAAEAY